MLRATSCPFAPPSPQLSVSGASTFSDTVGAEQASRHRCLHADSAALCMGPGLPIAVASLAPHLQSPASSCMAPLQVSVPGAKGITWRSLVSPATVTAPSFNIRLYDETGPGLSDTLKFYKLGTPSVSRHLLQTTDTELLTLSSTGSVSSRWAPCCACITTRARCTCTFKGLHVLDGRAWKGSSYALNQTRWRPPGCS